MADQNFRVKRGLEVGVGATVLTTTATGNIGIGSTNPQERLDVQGGNGFVRIGEVYSTFNGITLNNSTVDSDYNFISSPADRRLFINSPTGINFRIADADRFLLSSAGNLGINSSSPTSRLDVIGDAKISGVITATTFSGNATTATFATNAGIATNLKGGLAGNIPYQSAADTTVFLTNGSAGSILQSNGVGNAPSWVSAAPSNAITGLTIRDEGTIVGTANSITQLNFVGNIVSAAATAGIATITFADFVSTAGFATVAGISTNVIGGIASVTQLNVSGVTTVGFITATNIWNAGITTSGRIIVSAANSTADGGGQIYLNGATGNRIDFNNNGVAAPTFTTRSAGTKIVLNSAVGASTVDYAFGIETATLWSSVASSAQQFRWYGGTTQLADLKGSGELVIGSSTLTGTSSQRLQVTGGAYVSGSFGIGTTNPSYKLDVLTSTNDDGILITNSSTNGGRIRLNSSGTGGRQYHLVNTSNGSGFGGGKLVITDNTASDAARLAIDSSGNVLLGGSTAATGTASQPLQVTGGAYVSGNLGVGNTNPGAKLDVAGDIRLSAAGPEIEFNTGGARLRSSAANTLTIHTGGGLDSDSLEVVRINNTGVGIGTNNPLQKLHVLGNLLVAAGSSTAQHITQKAYELNNGTLSWEGSAGQLFSITNNLTSGSIFSVNDVSGIPSIDVNADGTVALAPYGTNENIGIGTTRPTSKFHLAGNGLVVGVLTATTFSGTLLGYASTAGIATNLKGGSGGTIVYQSAADTTAFLANGNSGYVLQANGGTNAPTWVPAAPSNAITGLTIRDEGTIVSTANSFSQLNFVGNIVSVAGTGPSGIATITFADFVSTSGTSTSVIGGIGSLTQLTVSGVSTFSNNINIASGIITTTGSGGVGIGSYLRLKPYLSEGGEMAFDYANGNIGYYLDVGPSNVFRLANYDTTGVFTFVTNSTEKLRITNAGLVGIGSASPVATLDVIGSAKVGTATTYTTVGGDSGRSIEIGVGSTTLSTYIDFQGSVTYTDYATRLIRTSGDNSDFNIINRGTGALRLVTQDAGTIDFVTNNTFRHRINSDGVVLVGTATSTGTASQLFQVNSGGYFSGSVGIGTATPARPLDVNGTARLADGAALEWGGTSAYIAGTSASNALLFGTSSSEKARIDSNGNLGINTTNPTSKLWVNGDARVSGVITATTFIGALTGIAASATQLVTPRTFQITGDVVASAISFDGTGNVSLAATIQPNSVGLGTDTTGDYVQTVTGTSNQITVTGGTGEGSTPTLSFPNQVTIPQDLTVTRDVQIDRNLNVNGNITIGGSSATLFTSELKIFDPDIVLGFRTDALGNDVSNDNTANHGGVALASTEGTPLVQLFIAGIETNPATYKKIMWFKAGTFSGLGTDAWLSNYAVGIGSTQFPAGTRFASGAVQFTESDVAVVRNINASGITTSGRVILSSANSTADGGGQIYLNGATGNRIDFNTNGVAAPSFTTRSAGTKIVLSPNISGSTVDIGFGIESATLWSSISNSTQQFKWYAGTTNIASLFGTGELVLGTTTKTGTASQLLQVTGGAYVSGVGVATGSIGVGITNPQGAIDIRTSPQWSSFNWGANLIIGGSRNNALGILDSTNSNPWAIGNGGGTLLIAPMPSLGDTTTGLTYALQITRSGNLIVGSGSSTGTASQLLQVSGGGYFSGAVGIGTTNPSSPLHIRADATDTHGTLKVENTRSSGGVHFPAASFINNVSNHSYGHVAEFRTIISGGGLDRPTVLFYSSGGSHSWSVGQVTGSWGVEDSFGIGYRASNNPDAFAAWPTNYFTILTSGNVGIQTSTPQGTLQVGAGTSTFIVTGIGSVGIGTTNPAETLHVSSSSGRGRFQETSTGGNYSVLLNPAGAGGPRISIGSNGDSSLIEFGAYNNINNLDTKARDLRIFSTAAPNAFTLQQSTGNIGINTTAPQGTLQVGVGTSTFIVTGTGSVGIGTTNPQEVLDVRGNFRLQNPSGLPEIRFRSPDGSTYQYYIGANISNVVDGGLIIGRGANISSGTPRILLAFNGNNGINTTSSSATLQIKDALAFETTNTTTTSTSQVAVDTFATATFRSAKYQVQVTCPGQISTLGGITTGGRGYTAGTYNVTFTTSSGNGSAAQGTLVVSNGTVGQISVSAGGTGYVTGDVLTASGGSGLQVSVGSTGASGNITSLTLSSAGTGYTGYYNGTTGTGTTSLSLLGGSGFNAVGLATIFDGVITSSTLLQQPTTGTGGTVFYSGSNYSTASVLSITRSDLTNTITTITGSVGVSTFTSLTAHGIGVSDVVRVSSTSNGLTAGTDYYVVSVPSTTTFTLGTSVGVGTTFTTGSSLSIGFFRNSSANGGQVAYTNAITGVSTNFQASDLMVLQNGTTADFIEYATIANNDILGTFASDISGANARLLFTPTYPDNTIKVARQAITV